MTPGFEIPRAPSARNNFNQPFEFHHNNHRFISTRAEFDVTDWLTVYGSYGTSKSEELRFVGTQQIFNQAGDFRSTILYEPSEIHSFGYDVGARAVFDIGPFKHKVIVSAAGVQRDFDFFSSTAVPSFINNIYNPVRVPRPDVSRLPRDAGLSLVNLNRGVAVADVVSAFDERVILTAGFRHQQVNTKSFSIDSGPAFGLGTARYKETAITPAAALVVKPLEALSLYANYIEGLQSGPTAPAGTVNVGEVFPPFVSKQIEFGAKYDFGIFGVAASAFEISRPSSFTDPATLRFSVNGEQVNRGLELNLFGEPLPGFRLIGGVAFLDGRLVKTAGGTFDDNIAPGVPEYQISLYGEYDLPSWLWQNLTLTGRVLHSAPQFYDQRNTQRIPDWTRFDVGLRYVTEGYNGKPVVLRASVENVFDSNYYQTAIDGLLSQGYPRVFLLSAQFDF